MPMDPLLDADFYMLEQQLDPARRQQLLAVREFMEKEVAPVINRYWTREEFPHDLVPGLAALGIAGLACEGYECPGGDPLLDGMVAMELARVDCSIATFMGVHGGLAMGSIYLCGSEEQKQRWLPPMARLEKIGAFALTEPDHGSDSVALETSATRDGDSWVINGEKKWIGNGSIADVVVVWARDTEDRQVKGFLVEKGTPGFRAEKIEGKGALRAVWQAQIELRDVHVPESSRLPGARGFADVGGVLVGTRSACAWMALGHAVAGFDVALTYAKRRKQFGQPLASFQIIQERLVKLLADVTAMQLYCFQIGQLATAGR